MAPPPPCCVLVVRCCSGSLPSPPPPRPSPSNNLRIARREFVLRSSELATLAAIFHLSGTKPRYLGVQKSPPSLALCPATNNCVSTCEDITDSIHYAPPWAKPITKHEAINQLIQVVTQTKPDNFTPRLVEKTDDYLGCDVKTRIPAVPVAINIGGGGGLASEKDSNYIRMDTSIVYFMSTK
uniref:Uncharacterized protein n=1 Tax=Oryza rufipogon TaxID=4529 RepID=A0A0E0P465_ORYRU